MTKFLISKNFKISFFNTSTQFSLYPVTKFHEQFWNEILEMNLPVTTHNFLQKPLKGINSGFYKSSQLFAAGFLYNRKAISIK